MTEHSEELVVVTSVHDPGLAEIIRLKLEDEGISCQIEGERQGGFTGVFPVRVFVRAEDVDRANTVLNVHANESMITRIRPMGIQIKKVCVPTDFSKYADHALAYGFNVAAAQQAELHILHVVQEDEDLAKAKSLSESMSTVFVTDFLERLEKQDSGEGAPTDDSNLWGDLNIIRTFRAGEPPDEITRYAVENEIDLLVVGTHGRSGLEHVLMGSVAQHLVGKAPCPVLVVGRGQREFLVD